MTLKTRFALAFIGNTILVLSLFGGAYFYFIRQDALKAQREEQIKMADKLSSVCREMYLDSNALVALSYVQALKKDPSIRFAACMDARGKIRVHSDIKRFGQNVPYSEDPQILQDGGLSSRMSADETGRTVLEWIDPVAVGGNKIGFASVAYDQELLTQELRAKLWEMLRQPIKVAGATFFIAVFIGLGLAWSLSRPIGKLAEAARAIGAGQWDYRTPIVSRKDEIGFLAREMNVMAERLKELDELKDEFISNVSHDLRNPMGAIRMFSEYMLEGDPERDALSPKQREKLMTIMDSATRLGVFVTNILDAAKIKAGRMEYHVQPTALGPILQNVRKLYDVMAAQKEIRLQTDIPADLPDILADPERLEQALANLASNALKFTKVKGTIVLGAKENGGRAEIYVTDNGKGIAKEDIPRLFRRFEQSNVAEQRARKIQGTGLGLAIVKQSIEAMGGGVEVASELGKGTRFTLSLPFAKKM